MIAWALISIRCGSLLAFSIIIAGGTSIDLPPARSSVLNQAATFTDTTTLPRIAFLFWS